MDIVQDISYWIILVQSVYILMQNAHIYSNTVHRDMQFVQAGAFSQ